MYGLPHSNSERSPALHAFVQALSALLAEIGVPTWQYGWSPVCEIE
jgi:D-mannonate dehydratase